MAKYLPIAVFAIICCSLISSSSALIEGNGTYYGFFLPEPFYNYWNYTTDIKDMNALCNQNNFGAAADIFVKGKNNARNATAGVFRVMHDFTFRNLSEGDASWWGIYTKHFNSMQYLKDLIDPPLYGNGSFAGACCGERAAALDVYFRLWQVAYAQHESDAGVKLDVAEEAAHGFAVLSSPVDEKSNHWKYIEGYSSAACIKKARDPVTGNLYAPANIAHRDTFGEMEKALASEDPVTKQQTIAAVRAKMATQNMIKLMQVFMVNARKAALHAAAKGPLKANACYKPCWKAAHKAGAAAAWTAMKPLTTGGDQASLQAVEELLNTTPAAKWTIVKWLKLRKQVEALCSSLGVNMKQSVYGCA